MFDAALDSEPDEVLLSEACFCFEKSIVGYACTNVFEVKASEDPSSFVDYQTVTQEDDCVPTPVADPPNLIRFNETDTGLYEWVMFDLRDYY